MELPILIEPVENNGYRASSGPPLNLQIEAATRDEAFDKLSQLVQSRLGAGAEVRRLNIRTTDHLLARFAGMLKDDPLLDDWKNAMEEYRNQKDWSAQSR